MESKKLIKKALKIVLVVCLILIVTFIIYTLRNFFIIRTLQKNIKPYVESKNFHIKSVATEESGVIVTVNYYEKDGKKVAVLERNDNNKISKITIYDDGEKRDNFYDNEEGKTAQLNVDTQISISIYNYLETDNIFQTLISSCTAKIKETQYNGKRCYVINNFVSPMFMLAEQENEVYIEKDTGLFIKSKQDSLTTQREYEFNNVDDSIFVKPDIQDYEIK